MISPREQGIQDLDNALEGLLQIHVWRGNLGPWMMTKTVGFGEAVDPEQVLDGSGFTQEFIDSTAMEYDGVMPLDEVEQRLITLRSYSE
jgi:hypothetical protein